MKPVAPELPYDDAKPQQPNLQSEIRRLCDTKASDERVTIPSPPSEEALRAEAPVPPEDGQELTEDTTGDTLPAPPPSAKKREDGDDAPSTIPGPPPLPRITGV
jgi:hypothetical protein